MNEINLLDRVIIPKDLQGLHSGKIIPAGTIGTVREFIQNNSIALIQYDSDSEEPQFVGIPAYVILKATKEDLMLVKNPPSIIPALYHIGNRFAFKNLENSIGIINSIILNENEQEDIIIFDFGNNVERPFPKSYIESSASYIPFELPPFPEDDMNQSNPVINHPITEPQQSVQNDEVKLVDYYNKSEENKTVSSSEDILKLMFEEPESESANDEPIFISVGKFGFKFIDGALTSEGLENLNLKDIKQLQRVLTLLEKLFTK